MASSSRLSNVNSFDEKLTHVGHVVSAAGVEPDREKINAFDNWRLNAPKNLQQLPTFLQTFLDPAQGSSSVEGVALLYFEEPSHTIRVS